MDLLKAIKAHDHTDEPARYAQTGRKYSPPSSPRQLDYQGKAVSIDDAITDARWQHHVNYTHDHGSPYLTPTSTSSNRLGGIPLRRIYTVVRRPKDVVILNHIPNLWLKGDGESASLVYFACQGGAPPPPPMDGYKPAQCVTPEKLAACKKESTTEHYGLIAKVGKKTETSTSKKRSYETLLELVRKTYGEDYEPVKIVNLDKPITSEQKDTFNKVLDKLKLPSRIHATVQEALKCLKISNDEDGGRSDDDDDEIRRKVQEEEAKRKRREREREQARLAEQQARLAEQERRARERAVPEERSSDDTGANDDLVFFDNGVVKVIFDNKTQKAQFGKESIPEEFINAAARLMSLMNVFNAQDDPSGAEVRAILKNKTDVYNTRQEAIADVKEMIGDGGYIITVTADISTKEKFSFLIQEGIKEMNVSIAKLTRFTQAG